MRVLIIDGQGGGVGRALIEQIKLSYPNLEIMAVGTNCVATSAMKKAGADMIATGENSIIYNSGICDIILGPMGIISANSMYGEISPNMAQALSASSAIKILIPISKCNIRTAGTKSLTLNEYVLECVELLSQYIL